MGEGDPGAVAGREASDRHHVLFPFSFEKTEIMIHNLLWGPQGEGYILINYKFLI